MTRQLQVVFATAMFWILASPTAFAASYADQFDPTGTVAYTNISDVNGLYGAPSVSFNSLDFTPTTFDACVPGTQCATGQATTQDILTLDINTVAGQQITEIGITEGLDYSIQALGEGAFATVVANANIIVDIFEVNQASINVISESFSMTFTPSNNASVFGPVGIDSGFIDGDLTIDVQSILAANAVIGEATGVRISFDNTLQAFHGGGGGALIRKRDADFVSITINGGLPVPEPGTALLMMGGLAALAAGRARD